MAAPDLIPVFPAEGSFLGPAPVILPARKISPDKTVGFTPKVNLQYKPCPVQVPDVAVKLDFSDCVENVTVYKPVDLALIDELSSDIRDHFETRLQNDFSLFVQIYKTNLVFTEYQTHHQVGQAKGSEATYAAAHCCTFPNLSCTRFGQGSAYMFAYESTSYLNRNATTIVPTEVNKIDTALEATIRQAGIQILNALAPPNTDITPKDAFKHHIFLMKSRLEVLLKEKDDDPVAQKIIFDYLRVCAAYNRFLQHQEEHITHKLCFAFKRQPPVNEDLFRDVQSEINAPANEEMKNLQKQYERVKNDDTVLLGQKLKYVNFCLNSEEAQAVVRDYFTTVSEAEKEADNKLAHDPKLSFSTAEKIGFSAKMLNVFKTCLKVIQSFNSIKGIKPKKLHELFPRILKEVMAQPKPQVLLPTPVIQPIVVTRAAAGAQVPAVQLSPTAEKYAKKMKNAAAVKALAAQYFSAASAAIREADLKQVGLLQRKNKIEDLRFSSIMLQLVQASLQAIRTPKTANKFPKQLDLILEDVLTSFGTM